MGGVYLFSCPVNDDWFWIFATLAAAADASAGEGPLAVTNDHMRDHSSLRSFPNNLFTRWRHRHVVGFAMDHPIDNATKEGRGNPPVVSVSGRSPCTRLFQRKDAWWHLPIVQG